MTARPSPAARLPRLLLQCTPRCDDIWVYHWSSRMRMQSAAAPSATKWQASHGLAPCGMHMRLPPPSAAWAKRAAHVGAQRSRMATLSSAATTPGDGDHVPESSPLFSKLSMPVYSLSTCGDEEGPCPKPTMNMVTYAAPVSIKPRRFALGLYLGTLSHENFKQAQRGMLQVLCKKHASLFNTLGQMSGRDTDKIALVEDAGFRVELHEGLPVLADAACVMYLKAASDFIPCGDHEVVICDVVECANGDAAPEDALYTADLRKAGYMQ